MEKVADWVVVPAGYSGRNHAQPGFFADLSDGGLRWGLTAFPSSTRQLPVVLAVGVVNHQNLAGSVENHGGPTNSFHGVSKPSSLGPFGLTLSSSTIESIGDQLSLLRNCIRTLTSATSLNAGFNLRPQDPATERGFYPSSYGRDWSAHAREPDPWLELRKSLMGSPLRSFSPTL